MPAPNVEQNDELRRQFSVAFRTVQTMQLPGCRLDIQAIACHLPAGQEILLFCRTSNPDLWPTMPSLQWVLWVLSTQLQWLGLELTAHLHQGRI